MEDLLTDVLVETGCQFVESNERVVVFQKEFVVQLKKGSLLLLWKECVLLAGFEMG